MADSQNYLYAFLIILAFGAVSILIIHRKSRSAGIPYTIAAMMLVIVAVLMYFLHTEGDFDPITGSSTVIKPPDHCSNGSQDADEEGVDCGGSCSMVRSCKNLSVRVHHMPIDD